MVSTSHKCFVFILKKLIPIIFLSLSTKNIAHCLLIELAKWVEAVRPVRASPKNERAWAEGIGPIYTWAFLLGPQKLEPVLGKSSQAMGNPQVRELKNDVDIVAQPIIK